MVTRFPECRVEPEKDAISAQLFCLLAAVQFSWAESGRKVLYQVCLKMVHEELSSYSGWDTCAVSFIKEMMLQQETLKLGYQSGASRDYRNPHPFCTFFLVHIPAILCWVVPGCLWCSHSQDPYRIFFKMANKHLKSAACPA